MSEETPKKKPKLVSVLFLEQWRGHDPGSVAELTEERAAELLAAGSCQGTAELTEAELKAKSAAAVKRAAELKKAAKNQQTVVANQNDIDRAVKGALARATATHQQETKELSERMAALEKENAELKAAAESKKGK